MFNLNNFNKLNTRFLGKHIKRKYKKNIKNKNCSIISMNCVGGGGKS